MKKNISHPSTCLDNSTFVIQSCSLSKILNDLRSKVLDSYLGCLLPRYWIGPYPLLPCISGTNPDSQTSRCTDTFLMYIRSYNTLQLIHCALVLVTTVGYSNIEWLILHNMRGTAEEYDFPFLKGVSAKNERGYRLAAKNKHF